MLCLDSSDGEIHTGSWGFAALPAAISRHADDGQLLFGPQLPHGSGGGEAEAWEVCPQGSGSLAIFACSMQMKLTCALEYGLNLAEEVS